MKALIRVQLDTYNDYPQSAKNNAKRGIELNEKVGNRCATQVGKVRARQIVAGTKLSVSTIKRVYSYLSRAEEYYDEGDSKACGTISYLLWGGKSMKRWAEAKLKKLGEISLAEIGPRGGIKRSKKAPKSKTKNPNPKRGSSRNPKGAAKKGSGVKVSKEAEASLRKKADEFNEKHKEKLGYGVTIGMLKTVYSRGLGAFQTSHSPNVKSAEQWAQARVNAFLYLVKNGRPERKAYTTDFDILPSKHPKSPKNKK